jgi:DNA-binding NarL/FixJ family response regulator
MTLGRPRHTTTVLSPRETQVLWALIAGQRHCEIAKSLKIDPATVWQYKFRAALKLGLSRPSDAVLAEAARRHFQSLTDQPPNPPSSGLLGPAPAREAPGFFGER